MLVHIVDINDLFVSGFLSEADHLNYKMFNDQKYWVLSKWDP